MNQQEYIQNLANTVPQHLALTGRIADWLKSPQSRLPASCTTFSVEDSMEGRDGIEDSWIFTSHGLRNAAGVAIDLSKLRARDTDNCKGLISSGAVSFGRMYSQLNQLLRRGGIFRNGAITLFLDHNHPDCEEYLKATSADFPWAKRSLYVDNTIIDNPLLPLIAEKVNQGIIWLAKEQWDDNGERLYSNVCQEIVLKSRGTCLISNVNLGAIEDLADLIPAFEQSMLWLCQLHGVTGVNDSLQYLDPKDDRQVGLGVIGLASMLAIHECSYKQFVEDLSRVNQNLPVNVNSVAFQLNEAYQAAAKIADSYYMDRAFTVAPTANSHRNYEDADGFTTSAEISPPINYSIDRDSELFGVETYEFHPLIEIAKDVGWDTQWKLLNEYQTMMDNTDLAHAISANIWLEQHINSDWIVNTFMPSSLKTTYYRLPINQDALDKTQVIQLEDNQEAACPIIRLPVDDPNFCESCSG